MRNVLLLSVLAFGIGTQSFADQVEIESGDNQPVWFHHASPTVIIHRGVGPINIQTGNTPVDKPRIIVCASLNGCIITARAFVTFTEQVSASLSVYVDNVAIEPQGPPNGEADISDQASTIVSTGTHTIQSMIYQQNSLGKINGWEIEYTQYELN